MPNTPFVRKNTEHAYRAFYIDGKGHVLKAAIIDAFNDDEATKLARQLVDAHAIELWDRDRIIAKFGLDDKPLSAGPR